MKYSLFDQVELLKELPKYGLPAGAVGVVVELYPATDGLEVEFMDSAGETIAVVTLDGSTVRRLTRAEIG